MNNQRGVSLTELVVSVGVAAVIVMGLAGVMQNFQKMSESANVTSAIAENVQDTRVALAVNNQCNLNLQSVSLDIANPAGTAVTQPLKFVDPVTSQTRILSQVGQGGKGYIVQDVHLKPVTQSDVSFIIANLEITYKKLADGTTVPRDIGILAQVQSGKVQKCWVRKNSGTITANQLCRAMSGGPLNEFDSATGQCGVTGGHWVVSSDPNSATCPAGTRFPRYTTADSTSVCQIIAPPTFVDPDPPPSVTFPDGSKALSVYGSNAGPYMANPNVATNSCTCIYDQKIGATISQFKCEILCVTP